MNPGGDFSLALDEQETHAAEVAVMKLALAISELPVGPKSGRGILVALTTYLVSGLDLGLTRGYVTTIEANKIKDEIERTIRNHQAPRGERR